MGLSPLTTSRLRGRAGHRGKTLTVTDPNGNVIVEAMERQIDDRVEMVIDTAGGRWRVEQSISSGSEIAALDSAGNAVATSSRSKVVLADGEVLSWEQRSLPTRYRLGDLWVAKGSWRSKRRFSAELSEAMLARDDRSMLVGVASLLTQHAVVRRRQLLGAAAGAGG